MIKINDRVKIKVDDIRFNKKTGIVKDITFISSKYEKRGYKNFYVIIENSEREGNFTSNELERP